MALRGAEPPECGSPTAVPLRHLVVALAAGRFADAVVVARVGGALVVLGALALDGFEVMRKNPETWLVRTRRQ
ncbi:hypothetical protein [Halorubellus salinus]|uniref:hypothetical protein n=1 Tax=Halorubellus salinus TaxID=755309 RepID=UPI001D06431F|nr:hypothetical protein [Halorubellus salinus]